MGWRGGGGGGGEFLVEWMLSVWQKAGASYLHQDFTLSCFSIWNLKPHHIKSNFRMFTKIILMIQALKLNHLLIKYWQKFTAIKMLMTYFSGSTGEIVKLER